MSYKIYPTVDFKKAAKKIASVYPDFKSNLFELGKKLKKNPLSIPQLDPIGDGLFKCRIDITGKTAGKSYGARIVYLLISSDNEVWMMECFDKSTKKDLSDAEEKDLRLLAKAAQKAKPGDARSDLLKSIYRKKRPKKGP